MKKTHLIAAVLIVVIGAAGFLMTSLGSPAVEQGEQVFAKGFETLDIYGNTVGSEMFDRYDLTMVYVWGTF